VYGRLFDIDIPLSESESSESDEDYSDEEEGEEGTEEETGEEGTEGAEETPSPKDTAPLKTDNDADAPPASST
jgi:TFIIF-interacting CTD phosphatase-like protein